MGHKSIQKNIIPAIHSFNSYKAEKAIQVLIENIDSIPDVQNWARKANISRGWLCKTMKTTFGKLPNKIIREVRYEKIVQLMDNNVEATSYSIARESGLTSGDALRMFLTRHRDTNFRKLRKKILTGDLEMKWMWLENPE